MYAWLKVVTLLSFVLFLPFSSTFCLASLGDLKAALKSMNDLIQDGGRLVAAERGAVAPADAGEGGRGGGGTVRREGRRATPGGNALLRPRHQDPRQGGPGR